MSFTLLNPPKGTGWMDEAGRPSSIVGTIVGQTAALPGAMSGPFLPEVRSGSRQRGRASTGPSPLKRSDSTLMMTIAAGPDGTVEHWKNLAKKVESDLALEQEQHRRDCEQDFEALNRVSRRISILEAAADDRDLGLTTQKKRIKVLREQLAFASKRFERELDFVKLQAEEIKLKLSLIVAENDQKIGGLKQELQVSEFKRELLQGQLDELLKLLDEPLDRLGRPRPLETRDDSSVNDTSFGFLKRVIGLKGKSKQGRSARTLGSPVQQSGFLSGLLHKKEPQLLSDPISNDSEMLRTRVEKSFVAEKIIQIREENARLVKELSDKSEKLTSMTREVERLKRGVREAATQKDTQERLEGRIRDLVTERDAANHEAQEAERMLDSLVDLERSVSASTASHELDELTCGSPGLPDGQNQYNLIKMKDAGLENSRWFSSLRRLHQSCGQLLLKVDASQKVASQCRADKETLNQMILAMRTELLAEPDKKGRPESPGLLRLYNFATGNVDPAVRFREQDPLQVFAIIKEQKLKLLKAHGVAEDLRKAKASADSMISDYEMKLANVQEIVKQLANEKKDFLETLNSANDLLKDYSEEVGGIVGDEKNVDIVPKIQQLLQEKDELQALSKRFIHGNNTLEQELKDLKSGLSQMQTLMSAVDGILDLEHTHSALHGTWELKIAAKSLADRARSSLTGYYKGEGKVLDNLVKQREELENLREDKEKNMHEIQELSMRIQEMESALDFVGSEEDVEEPRVDKSRSGSVTRIKHMKLQKDKLEAASKEALAKLFSSETEKEELQRRHDQHTSDVAEKLQRALAEKEEAERLRLEHERRLGGSQEELDRLKQHLKNVQSSIKDHAAPVTREYTMEKLEMDSDHLDLFSALEGMKAELSILRAGKNVDSTRVQDLQAQISETEKALVQFYDFVDRQLRAYKDGEKNLFDSGLGLAGNVRAVESRVVELQVLRDEEKLKMQSEIEAAKLASQQLSTQLRELEALRADFADKVWRLKNEILRLGGYDIDDEMEKHRRLQASGKVKDILISGAALAAKHASTDHPTLASSPGNPLNVLATFEVELLVNSKVHQQLKIGGTMGGVCQAAVHYFHVDTAAGDVSFQDATMPGSQSSNMLLDLVLMPEDEDNPYESQPGDILGLCVKVMTFHDKTSREVLYNNNVIRTDEVMDAIRGQTIENFSLWPDLVSSWRWERSNLDRWTLVCVRWRFLLKNIFPELSEPLQLLAIGQHNLRASNALIRTV